PSRRSRGVDADTDLVRQGRLDAGLSMAQLAGTEITRQAIFLIEAGKMRPSMRTLRMIAARTGKPVEFFIDGPSGRLAADEMANDPRVDQLQALCLRQQFGDAIELAMQLL